MFSTVCSIILKTTIWNNCSIKQNKTLLQKYIKKKKKQCQYWRLCNPTYNSFQNHVLSPNYSSPNNKITSLLFIWKDLAINMHFPEFITPQKIRMNFTQFPFFFRLWMWNLDLFWHEYWICQSTPCHEIFIDFSFLYKNKQKVFCSWAGLAESSGLMVILSAVESDVAILPW